MFAKRSIQKNLRNKNNSQVEQGKDGVEKYEGEKKLLTSCKKKTRCGDSVCEEPKYITSDALETILECQDNEDDVIFKSKLPPRKQIAKFITAQSRKGKLTRNDIIQEYNSNINTKVSDGRATAVFDVDTDKSCDHRAILERNDKIADAIAKGEMQEGIYRGQGAYRAVIKRREGALSQAKTTGLYGPVRGTNNVRMTMYTDYNPEICKDYKETGYCGYGDTCIYIHDRSDYKGGWQIEKEWQEEQKKKQEKLRRLADGEKISDSSASESESDADSGEESTPFACLKCRQRWTIEMNPVVTKCGHHYCENCALSHHVLSAKCFQCGTETMGIFNTAHDVIGKLEQHHVKIKESSDTTD